MPRHRDDTPRPSACQNCGTPLQGDHCYACGQPVKGAVRHFSSIIGDFLDTVFEYDGRLWRTLGPLLWRPGFLSNEYLAGRRVRYVSPFRLFFFITVIAFLLAQLVVAGDFGDGLDEGLSGTPRNAAPFGANRFSDADTEAEVIAMRDAALAGLREGMGAVEIGPAAAGVRAGREAAEAAVREAADRRLAELRAAAGREGAAGREDAAVPTEPAAVDGQDTPRGAEAGDESAGSEPEPPPTAAGDRRREDNEGSIRFNGQDWDPVTNPVRIGWLPEIANQRINRGVGRIVENARSMRQASGRRAIFEAFVASIPATLFVLLPIFAVLLKVAYVFKRRLYMEHLIIALHSHSFLSLSLLLLFAMLLLSSAFEGVAWITTPLGWAKVAVLAWMPIYLFLMQKWVYRQGWIMTLFKYCLLGIAYTFLLSFAATIAFLVNMATL